MKFLSYNLNKNININNNSKQISFFKPIGCNGYFPIGHSVFNSELANKMNAFLVNGDIRFPQKYQKKFTFSNIDVLERQGKELNKKIKMNYSFINPIPPIDKSQEGENRQFVSLGELIVRNQDDEEIKNDRNLMGCIRKSCAKEISVETLELMAVKISNNKTNNKINKILNYKVNNVNYDLDNETLDIYSIWKTPMNTFFTNSVIGNHSLEYGTIGSNIVSGNPIFLDENAFRLNSDSLEMVINRLKKIEIPKIVRIVYIMVHQYKTFFDKILYILENIIIDLKKEKNKLKTGKKTNKQRARDEKKIMDINEKVDIFENIIDTINQKNIFNDFDSLFDAQTQQTLEDNLPNFKNMRKNLSNIPLYVNQNVTLYDLLIFLFPMGLNSILDVQTSNIIENDKIKIKKTFFIDAFEVSPIQLEILKICKVCFPPNVKVYIPKNECMSYNTIDLDRRTLYKELNNVINYFENIEMEYLNKGYENTNENKFGEDNSNNIQNQLKKLDTQLNAELSHIKDFYKKIKERDMEQFSNSRIQLIINYFRQKIKIVENNCVIKE